MGKECIPIGNNLSCNSVGNKTTFVKIKVVIPFHQGDVEQARQLLFWIQEIDDLWDNQHLDFDVYLVCPWMGRDVLSVFMDYAKRLFRSATLIMPSSLPQDCKWPRGANAMWLATIKDMESPFLWLEPDSVPLCPGWLDTINEAYWKCGLPFMGSINEEGNKRHLSGVAVYPGNMEDHYHDFNIGDGAFDMWHQDKILPNVFNSRLIFNFWGQHGFSPTFRETLSKEDPLNTLTPRVIPPESVLFHRCKDSSLTGILRNRRKVIAA